MELESISLKGATQISAFKLSEFSPHPAHNDHRIGERTYMQCQLPTNSPASQPSAHKVGRFPGFVGKAYKCTIRHPADSVRPNPRQFINILAHPFSANMLIRAAFALFCHSAKNLPRYSNSRGVVRGRDSGTDLDWNFWWQCLSFAGAIWFNLGDASGQCGPHWPGASARLKRETTEDESPSSEQRGGT